MTLISSRSPHDVAVNVKHLKNSAVNSPVARSQRMDPLRDSVGLEATEVLSVLSISRTATGWAGKQNMCSTLISLLSQTTKSLNNALKIHSSLTQYVVCFPFDVTGPTGRQGLSGLEKFTNWQNTQEQAAAVEGRQLTIEAWSAFKLRDLLLEHDTSGGIREFFFNQLILTTEWFSDHLDLAKKTAGPRYTPKLNVRTDLWRCFAAFGRTNSWSKEFRCKLRACRNSHDKILSSLDRPKSDPSSPSLAGRLTRRSEVHND